MRRSCTYSPPCLQLIQFYYNLRLNQVIIILYFSVKTPKMGLMRAACYKTPQSQGTSTPQPQAMAVTTDAKQAQFKARHTDDYYYYYYYAA